MCLVGCVWSHTFELVKKAYSLGKRTKKCNHKWRVGSKNAKIINKKLVITSVNIWCEKCDEKIEAFYSDYELIMCEWFNRKIKKPTKVKLT